MKLNTYKLSQHPELEPEFHRLGNIAWPEFIHHDKAVKLYWEKLLATFSDFQIIVLNDKKETVGIGHSIPIYWDGALETLPSNGWDGVLCNGFRPG